MKNKNDMLTKKEIDEAFKKYTPLLHRLSHSCAMRCGRPEAEVFGQACYEFMECTKSFRKSKGTFGTWMYAAVKSQIAHWAKKMDLPLNTTRTNDDGDALDITDILPSREASPVHKLELKEWMQSLTEEGQLIISIVLNGPAEMMGLAEDSLMKKKHVLGHLTRYLRKSKGWSYPRVWKAMAEVKLAIKEI